MAFIPVPNVASFEILWTYQSEECENVVYFQRDSGWNAQNLFDFAGAIYGNVVNLILPTSPNSLVLRGVKGTDLTTDFAPTAEYTEAAPDPGLSNAQAAPNNVSLAITFRTGARGRTARGRNYVVGIQEDEVSNNFVANSVVDRWMSLYDVFVGSAFKASADWVVVSRYVNNAPRAQGLARPVTTYGPVDQTVDSMRRRLPGRGT